MGAAGFEPALHRVLLLSREKGQDWLSSLTLCDPRALELAFPHFGGIGHLTERPAAA